ncbi:EamA family transporter [Cryptosporangium phraense]|uniref:EamA family transporter n=2 Tax=Cryptosporangium phraense TaxID=2593070 RepID=A0A545AE95_9ACTN|nr:EamA family transporter [Cryptosporangium phraense]
MLVVAGVCWGTGGVTGRALSEVGGLSAPAVAAYRLLIGGALLVVVLAVRRRRPRGGAAWRRVLAVAGLAAVFQASYFSAVAVSSVTISTLIAIGSAPLLVLAVDAVTTRRLPERATIRPVLLGLTGLALLVGAPTGQSLGRTLAGVGLSLVAGAGFALLTLLGRRPVDGLDEATTTGYGFLLGGTGLLLALGTSADLGVRLSLTSLGLLALLGTVPTALAYTLYFRGLRSSTAVTATVVALLEPLTATVLAVALLGERLSVPAAVGAVVLLISVVDSGRRREPLTTVAT